SACAAPSRTEGNDGSAGVDRIEMKREDPPSQLATRQSALFRSARARSVSGPRGEQVKVLWDGRTGPCCGGPDFSFRQGRSFLGHEGVAHRDTPIEIAEVGGLSEFRQFVVFGRQFPIALRLAQRIVHDSSPTTNPIVRTWAPNWAALWLTCVAAA